MAEKIHIFDTTLRDGEQSAGIAFTPEEKLEIAKQLERLGVDVIEAGFPCSTPGDLAAVQAIAKEVRGTTICRPRACRPQRCRYRLGVDQGSRGPTHPRLHQQQRHPDSAPAEEGP